MPGERRDASLGLLPSDGAQYRVSVHDALLVEAPRDQITSAIAEMQRAMAEASELVLNGFQLRTKPEATIYYPDRYMDEKRGRKMWDTVMGILTTFDN